MKKVFCILLPLLLLFAFLPLTSSAEKLYLHDEVGLLTEEEQAKLEEKLKNFSERNSFDLVIYLVSSTDGKSITAFADDAFDYGGYGVGENHDGSLLALNMETGDAWISTSGLGISVFTDYGIQRLFDTFLYDPRSSPYSALCTYISECQSFLDSADSGDPIDVSGYGTGFFSGSRLVFASVCGAIVALIAILVMKRGMKSVRAQAAANQYAVRDSFRLTRQQDMFLYRNVTKIRRDTDDGGGRSGGGSSTHRSSSGRSHGGGGRHF